MQSTTYLISVVLLLMRMSVVEMQTGDIVQTAINSGQFNTLATALQAAGLVGALRGRGPFTVFAPTDAAFARLPPGVVHSLLRPENRHQLINLLQFHVIGGRALTAAQILSMPQPIRLHALNGRTIPVMRIGRQVRISGANLVAANVQATNGLIHVVDRVLGF